MSGGNGRGTIRFRPGDCNAEDTQAFLGKVEQLPEQQTEPTIRDRILKVLDEADGPMSLEELSEVTEIPTQKIGSSIYHCVRGGYVAKDALGRYEKVAMIRRSDE